MPRIMRIAQKKGLISIGVLLDSKITSLIHIKKKISQKLYITFSGETTALNEKFKTEIKSGF